MPLRPKSCLLSKLWWVERVWKSLRDDMIRIWRSLNGDRKVKSWVIALSVLFFGSIFLPSFHSITDKHDDMDIFGQICPCFIFHVYKVPLLPFNSDSKLRLILFILNQVSLSIQLCTILIVNCKHKCLIMRITLEYAPYPLQSDKLQKYHQYAHRKGSNQISNMEILSNYTELIHTILYDISYDISYHLLCPAWGWKKRTRCPALSRWIPCGLEGSGAATGWGWG